MSTTRPTAGRIVWRELMTTDPRASLAFHTELFGWRTTEHDMGPMGKYTMFYAGEKGLGGMMPIDASKGAPSHWVAYITVDDVDATAARVPGLGGKILVPPSDIPDVGRFSIISDPLGGTTALFKDAKGNAAEDEGMPPIGAFCWQELITTDPDAAVKFYSAVYGWTTKAQDMGPMGTYHVLQRGDCMVGGVMKNPPGAPPITMWIGHVRVADIDASTARVPKLGGKVIMGPFDIPGQGRGATVTDPSGAIINMFQGANG